MRRKCVLQGEFSRLHMLVNASLEVKNVHLFELSGSDRTRSVSPNILVLPRFTIKCLCVCTCVLIYFICVLIR